MFLSYVSLIQCMNTYKYELKRKIRRTKMLYKQEHRGRDHLYWSKSGKLSERISIGKLKEIEQILQIFFGNKSRNKRSIRKLLILFDRRNLVSFLDQDKRVVLNQIKAIKEVK